MTDARSQPQHFIHLPSGRPGIVVDDDGGDLVPIRWGTGSESRVDRDDLRALGECLSCGDANDQDRCPRSERACGHHCNQSWSHDKCSWCGRTWGEVIAETGNRTPTPRPPDLIKAMSTSVGIPETGRKTGKERTP